MWRCSRRPKSRFRWHGLEFARARISHEAGSFGSGQEFAFGVGAEERVFEDRNQAAFTDW